MQIGNEPSAGCPKPQAARHSHYSGIVIDGLFKPNEERSVHLAVVEHDNQVKKDGPPQNYLYNRSSNRQELLAWPNYYPDIQKVRRSQMKAYESHSYPLNSEHPSLFENRNHRLPLRMFYQGNQCGVPFQEFQYFVVIDFEATCDKETKPEPQEIIEFPSVLVNSMTGQLEASFQTYVRPAYHQDLTDFCKELTGIEQIQVDRGVPLAEALLMHDKWLEDKGIKQKTFAVVTWGNWDCRTMLESECRFKGIRKPPYFNRWINLKVLFQNIFGGVRRNLKEAVELAGLSWEGRPHCGLDDARNTARLLTLLMCRGFRFSITNSLVWQEPPRTGQQFVDRPIINPPMQSQMPEVLAGTTFQYHPSMDAAGSERYPYCFCGVLSSKCVIRKPGPTQGRCFFGCGNWTASRGAACNYFAWASP